MVQLSVVYGEWVVKNSLWEFVVDDRKGGKICFLYDGCTYREFLEMAQKDYDVDKKLRWWS